MGLWRLDSIVAHLKYKFVTPSDNKKIQHIAVAGNIGAGKTTLAEKLGKHFGWDIFYEDVDENPYLADFYGNMRRWSFNLQVYFLNSRFAQVQEIRAHDKPVIQDRTIYEDAHIFAPNLYEMNLMQQRDFETYIRLFKNISSLVAPPDLLIYLHAPLPALMKQIKRRGRNYESKIRPDYLASLNQYYESWIENYKNKVLVININEVNFADNEDDLKSVIAKVQKAIDS
ncbi:MAG: deoxynucleoside kinase, partial [Chitinophagales bacterium]